MRRALASLLLVFWIAGTCAPLLAQSNLPACCRIDGKHHCTQHVPGDGFQAAPCADYEHSTALISSFAAAPEVRAHFGIRHSHWNLRLPHESSDLVAFRRGEIQKRGPPLA